MWNAPRWLPATALVGATALTLAACPSPAPEAEPPAADPVLEEPGEPPERQFYEARLEEVDGSGVSGTATVTVNGERIQVTVVASGLDAAARVAQHIHANASCDPAGGILLNLDDALSVANEAAPRGDHYPQANAEGELEYEVSRSLDELDGALADHEGPALAELDLGNRVVNLHGADMQPIACGPLDGTM